MKKAETGDFALRTKKNTLSLLGSMQLNFGIRYKNSRSMLGSTKTGNIAPGDIHFVKELAKKCPI